MKKCFIRIALLISAVITARAGMTRDQLNAVKLELLVEVPGSPQMEPRSEGPDWRDGEVFLANRPFVRVTKDGTALNYLDLPVPEICLRGNGCLLLCKNCIKAFPMSQPKAR